MTECTCVVFQTLPGDSDESVLNSVGYLHDHMEAKVIDEQGLPVPFGTPGELCIRGYNSMVGYFDDAEKTNAVLDSGGWVHTGDRFVLHEDGYGQIVGRIKDLIIRGGENISPREIEDLLITHPDILEVYVIGVPDERLGEDLCAFARLKNGAKLTVNDIRNFCDEKISHFKIPKTLVIVDEFPKTTSGKVQKFKILEDYLSNIENKN